MDISKANNSLKIKTKTATFIIDPSDTLKNPEEYNFFIALNKNNKFNLSPTLKGAGDFEIKNVKISGFSKDERVSYLIRGDGIDTLFIAASALSNKDLLKEAEVVVILADGKVSLESLASTNCVTIVLWGENTDEAVKSINKEVKNIASKITVARDKLPSELEVNVIN